MKGSTVLSENILTGLSIIISFILMVLVVRVVLSQQSERSYRNLYESIARDITLIIDRLSSMSSSGKVEYRLQKGVKADVRIDYKSVFVSYGDKTVKKSFSGLLNSGPYNFIEPEVLCFIKDDIGINIFDVSCYGDITTTTSTTTQEITTTTADYLTTTISIPVTTTSTIHFILDEISDGRGIYGFYYIKPGVVNRDYVSGGGVYVNWGDIEQEEGRIDCSKLDEKLSVLPSGKKVYLHFATTEGGSDNGIIPDWFLDLGTKCEMTPSGNIACDPNTAIILTAINRGWTPIPWNEIYLEKLENALKLLAKPRSEGGCGVNDDSRIEFIQINAGGYYGELSLQDRDPYTKDIWLAAGYTGEKYSQANKDAIDIYMKVFTKKPCALMIGGGLGNQYNGGVDIQGGAINHGLNNYGMRLIIKFNGMGKQYRRHEFHTYCCLSPDHDITKARCSYEEYGNSGTYWRDPVVDWSGSRSEAISNFTIHADRVIEHCTSYHIIYNNEWNNPLDNEIRYISEHIGAQIQCKNVNFKNSVIEGEQVNFDFTFYNRGNVPLLYPQRVGVKDVPSSFNVFVDFVSSDGQTVFHETFKPSPETTLWFGVYGPGHARRFDIPVQTLITVSDSISPGIYDVRVGLSSPENDDLRLELIDTNGNDGDNRYSVGEITIS